MRRPRHALQVRRSSHNRLHTFNALRNSFLTLHSAFRAKGWEEISVFDIYDDHPAVYLSPDGPNRQPVDLNELPLLDERGAEIPIFSENGIRIPRRRATGLTNSTRLSIMQNLAKVSSLFVTSRPDADAMALDDEFDDDFDEAHTVNNADYELNIENARARERRDVRDTKYTLYPHFFSKTIGQWQSTGVIHTMLPHIRTLSSSLTRPDAAGHAVVALGSQCYNTSAHAMRDRSRFHVVQQGMLTGAAAGSWSTTEKGKATGKTLWNKLCYALPHEHVTAQLERDTGMYNSLRFENNLLIDFNHVRDDVRDGYLFYHDFILPYAQLCTRPQIVNALRDTSVLFPYGVSALFPPLARRSLLVAPMHSHSHSLAMQVFPEVYSWAAYPVTSLLTATWKRYVNPFFGPVPLSRRGVHPNDHKPKPHYIEFLACLERLLNFAYTGNAQVLPTRLMREIWAGRGIVDQGFPFLWPGLTWNTDRRYPLAITLQRWPVHPATERPLTASKCAQVITYGLPHYLVSVRMSSFLDVPPLTLKIAIGVRDRLLHAEPSCSLGPFECDEGAARREAALGRRLPHGQEAPPLGSDRLAFVHRGHRLPRCRASRQRDTTYPSRG